MLKILIPIIALALTSPINLADFDNGAEIYAKSSDSLKAEQTIQIDGQDVSEFPYSFEKLEEKTYSIKSGDNTYSLHIDNTAPVIEISGVEDGKSYKSATASVKITGEDESKITVNGKETKELNFTEDGKYTLKVTASDKAGNKAEKEISFSIVNQKPVITVNGLDNEAQNVPYSITASVSPDSDVTKTATLDGEEVDIFTVPRIVSEEGEHTLKVTAKDSAGNEADPYEKTFKIDYTKPEITVSGVTDGSVVKDANITVSAEGADETKITLDGKETESPVSVTEAGKHTLKVTAKDKAGNEADPVEISFTVVTEGPIITITGADKEMQNTSYTIDATYQSDAEIKSKVVKVDGTEVTLPYTVSEEGSHTVTVEATDVLDNTNSASKTFEIDQTKPVINDNGFALKYDKVYTNEAVSYDIAVSDKNLSEKHIFINGVEATKFADVLSADNNYTLKVTATDKAGNTAEWSDTVVLDKTVPVITPDALQYVTDLSKVSASVLDTNLKSFDVEVTQNGQQIGTNTSTGTTVSLASDPTKPTDSTTYLFKFTAWDKAGNSVVQTKEVIKDTTAPAISITAANGHVNIDVPVTVDIKDSNEDNTVLVITKDGEDFDKIEGKTKLSKHLSAEGKYKLSITSVDKAGNKAEDEISFVIDKTPPKTTLHASEGHVRNAQTIKVESNEKGTTYLKVVCDGNTIYDNKAEGDQSFSNLSRNGIYKVEAYSVDLAGNKSEVKKADFVVDTVAPKISLTGAKQNAYINKPVTLTAEMTERFFENTDVTISGTIKETGEKVSFPFKAKGQHTKLSKTFSKNGTYHIKMVAKDAAGNTAETKELVFTVDTIKPEVEVAVPTDGRYDALIAPKVTIKDDYFESKEISLSHGTGLSFKDSFGDKGGTRTYADFVRVKENDGRYTLTAKAVDKAGNTTVVSKDFVVNRFGSTFKTIKKPEGYMKQANSDVVIEETNVSGIKSYKCSVSKDASLTEARDVKVKTEGDVTTYTIPKTNFTEDGVYKVFLTTEDNSGNTSKSDGEFSFVIDNVAPVITYKGVEEGQIYKENSVKMYVSATDTLTEKPDIYVNVAGRHANVEEDENGTYVLIRDGINQAISIKATDKAGNTATQAIKDVTVSTSSFAFFRAHKGITAAIGAVLAVIAGLLGFLIGKKRKKDNEDKGDDFTF